MFVAKSTHWHGAEKMKEMKVKSLKIAENQNEFKGEDKESCKGETDSELENQKIESGVKEDSQKEETENLSADNDCKTKTKSSEIDIPQVMRKTGDCFVTGSWPRGILKSRSRSLSDSQLDSHLSSSLDHEGNVFGTSLDCDDDVLVNITEDDFEMSEENEMAVGSSPKKSVRFNEFVCKQVFKTDSSIVAQKAKNMKKAQQRKRSRERKLSEGSQSSEAETVTEHSDAATTTEEESNTDAENAGKESKKGKRASATSGNKFNKKKKEKCNKKNKRNKRPVLSLSNEMVFQLDDD